MNTLGFIIYWQKYGCVLWFFWYWIYFSRSIKQSQRNSSRKLGQHLILIKQSTFFKKGTNNFTTPYSMPLLSVSHQNKAFHNFHKGRQHPIARHKGSRLGPSSLATYLEYRMMILLYHFQRIYASKKKLDHTNLFSPNNYKKNDKIIYKYFKDKHDFRLKKKDETRNYF